MKILFCFLSTILTCSCLNGDNSEFDVCKMSSRVKSFSFRQKDYNTVFSTKVNWYRAVQICRMFGMQLLSFDDEIEANHVMKFLNFSELNYDFWSSGHNLGHPKEFKWFSTGVHLLPNDNLWVDDSRSDDDRCVYLDKTRNFQFNRNPCSKKNSFICETFSRYV